MTIGSRLNKEKMRGDKKEMKKKKGLKFEKFLVCPNCKKPLCRKKVLEIKGFRSRYCDRCGFCYADVIRNTPAGKVRND